MSKCKNCGHEEEYHDGGYWEKGSKKCSYEGILVCGCDKFEPNIPEEKKEYSSVDYGHCTLVSHVNVVDKGYHRFKFYEPNRDMYIFVNIPTEYYLMMIGARDWNHDYDQYGRLKTKK